MSGYSFPLTNSFLVVPRLTFLHYTVQLRHSYSPVGCHAYANDVLSMHERKLLMQNYLYLNTNLAQSFSGQKN